MTTNTGRDDPAQLLRRLKQATAQVGPATTFNLVLAEAKSYLTMGSKKELIVLASPRQASLVGLHHKIVMVNLLRELTLTIEEAVATQPGFPDMKGIALQVREAMLARRWIPTAACEQSYSACGIHSRICAHISIYIYFLWVSKASVSWEKNSGVRLHIVLICCFCFFSNSGVFFLQAHCLSIPSSFGSPAGE